MSTTLFADADDAIQTMARVQEILDFDGVRLSGTFLDPMARRVVLAFAQRDWSTARNAAVEMFDAACVQAARPWAVDGM